MDLSGVTVVSHMTETHREILVKRMRESTNLMTILRRAKNSGLTNSSTLLVASSELKDIGVALSTIPKLAGTNVSSVSLKPGNT